MSEVPSGARRILIVSNRLPVSVQRTERGLEYSPSTGGLATGLSSFHGVAETIWLGWPGAVSKSDFVEVEQHLRSEYSCVPVFLSEKLVERYYEGYSNRAIWPIFHSFPAYARHAANEWEAYQKANELFCHKVLEVYRPGDVLWIHDYHLMLMPRCLRQRLPHAHLGFFLHIPFPHFDIFRLLPQHREILEGLLALDLIGFHTHDYVQAFLGSIRRLLGQENVMGQVMVGDRLLQADVFPMGIDFAKYNEATEQPDLELAVTHVRRSLGSDKVVFSVSRLDYTKGIPESLAAIREFFRRFPDWREKLVFVLVVVPSRERVDRYASLKREIDEMVGQINSEYGTLDWMPIRYIYRSLSFGELISLYGSADVALIAPLRDGMNLIAKEYVATRRDGKGVLALSELAGASRELLEAITFNPNSVEEIGRALNTALTMSPEEQQRRLGSMQQRLEQHDIHYWVRRFFERLEDVSHASEEMAVKVLDEKVRAALRKDFARASQRLIVLDYDGTLVPFAEEPGLAKPDHELMTSLRSLTSSEKNRVVILSGRDRHTLEQWLGDLAMTLVAEHGGWLRDPNTAEWKPAIMTHENGWKKDIRPILNIYVERIPGSFIEEKNFSLVWHYRRAEPESATQAARDLLDTLAGYTINLSIQVLPGNKTVEVRNVGISKGAFFTQFLASQPYDFILAAGDDWTDEDLFAVLPSDAYSIKVGMRMSKAKYNLRSCTDVRSLLGQLEG